MNALYLLFVEETKHLNGNGRLQPLISIQNTKVMV